MDTQSDAIRLTVALGQLRLDTREAFHGLDKRLQKLEWTDNQFEADGNEWRKACVEQVKALEVRIAVFEAHKTRFAWLGWSMAIALGLGVLKIWLPALKAFL